MATPGGVKTTINQWKYKQGRNNLRQISYALFCSTDGHIPLFYDVYEGNRNDAKQFRLVLGRFRDFVEELSGGKCVSPETTLIFDKGNNSSKNFRMLDSMHLNFVGSVKLGEHKGLAGISNESKVFLPCSDANLKGTKAFRVKKKVYGKERVLVVTYSQSLFNVQWLTLQNDITKAIRKLSLLRQKLEDRANGLIKKGKVPTIRSVEKQSKNILSRQYMADVITVTVSMGRDEIPRLEYTVDTNALSELSDTYLGKTILITSRENWDDTRIIRAYRSQYIIEDVFKEMKDRVTGSWWPMNHWTDSNIRVHGLYCTSALLLWALLLRRVKQAGLRLSMKRILSELDAIREVVNIYPRKRRQKKERRQTVLTKTSELQQNLMSILAIKKGENSVLG